jgi:hypothetical protein
MQNAKLYRSDMAKLRPIEDFLQPLWQNLMMYLQLLDQFSIKTYRFN